MFLVNCIGIQIRWNDIKYKKGIHYTNIVGCLIAKNKNICQQ